MINPHSLIDLEVFARTLWGEARGEGRTGLQMVASVIMNRVNADLGNDGKPDWWGEGVKGVCLKKYQFSCWLEADPNRAKLLSVTPADLVFADCMDVAAVAMAGHLPDLTHGATHYANIELLTHLGRVPVWATPKNFTARHGKHSFYRVV